MCSVPQALSCVRLFATPWTAALQAPLSIEFSRQEYWSGLPFPFPGDLLNPGIEPRSPALEADCLPSEPPEKCRDTTTLPMARWVTRENSARTLRRNVRPRLGGGSEPVCMLRSKLDKKKQGIYRWCPWGIRAYFFKRCFKKKWLQSNVSF